MQLITWNIQWSRGIDGRVDPERIIDDARALADFDVLCLQEVAANFPTLAGSRGENQFELFARLLPDFTPVPIAGVDILGDDGSRRAFGNMILSRFPVERALRHQLPWPPDRGAISMPRTMLEVTLATPLGPIRVMTTHLEYHSGAQRAAQVERIRSLHAEACARSVFTDKRDMSGSPYDAYLHPTRAILTGDFNFRPEDPLHARVQETIDENSPRLVDTWDYLHPDTPHPHNVGLYDREQWPEPFTCDYIFASEDLLPRVRAVRVNHETQASDHQPQLLELE
jgi:endonuclease/exonuclease/phosphatase family metal-dependent hydrolase